MAERPAINRLGEPSLRYPIDLVAAHGAKAGLLIYVAEKLPHIPQMPMVVSRIGEPTRDFIARADTEGIRYPRLYRSSAVAELFGYEGDFPTNIVDDYATGHALHGADSVYGNMYSSRQNFAVAERHLVSGIRQSTVDLQNRGIGLELPTEINVIATELSPSTITGTYIKHPNQKDHYLMVATQQGYRQNFVINGQGPKKIMGDEPTLFNEHRIHTALEQVTSWHDQIASLPEMDERWAYQIEFGVDGIDPVTLFQVRPFKPIQKAENFEVKPDRLSGTKYAPVVIGVTPQEGIELQVVNFADRNAMRDAMDAVKPAVVVCDLRQVEQSSQIPNVQATLVSNSRGFLLHQDVRVMRRADVTAYTYIDPYGTQLQPGEIVTLISDGRNMQVNSRK